jgi:hypothetical protein
MVLARAQKGTTWVPSPLQSRLLEAAREPGAQRTITAICDAADVPRRTFYKQLADPDFKAAWDDVWSGAIKRHLPGIVAAQIHKALDGDTQAARLLMEAAGVLKQEYGGNAPVVIRQYIGVSVEHG